MDSFTTIPFIIPTSDVELGLKLFAPPSSEANGIDAASPLPVNFDRPSGDYGGYCVIA